MSFLIAELQVSCNRLNLHPIHRFNLASRLSKNILTKLSVCWKRYIYVCGIDQACRGGYLCVAVSVSVGLQGAHH